MTDPRGHLRFRHYWLPSAATSINIMTSTIDTTSTVHKAVTASVRVIARRWPTWLALGMTAATFGGSTSPDKISSLSDVLLLMPLLYLVVAKLKRREASWPTLVALIVPLIGLRMVDVIPPSAVFSGLALIVLVWGTIDGELRRPGPLRVQALGMLGFALLGFVGLAADPELGRYVVAAGFAFHGVWDFVHLKRDMVVSRSYAEWCGVLDIVIALELLFAL